MSKFDYEVIVQNYIYFHSIYLNFFYYFFLDLSSLLTITYYIIYLAPTVLYFSALINCYSYTQSGIPEKYSLSIINVVILILSLAYVVMAFMGLLSTNHESWSLAVILNIGLFLLTL